jgi:hypothetical protein
MALKTQINLLFEDTIAGGVTDLKLSAIVPTGRKVLLLEFSGYDRPLADGIGSIIGLQWGQGASWETLVAGGFGTFNFQINRTFIGDGVNRFRVVRINKSALAKELYAWSKAVLL